MTRKISLPFRATLVASLCALLVVSPATAGGFLKRLGCKPKAACPIPPKAACEAPPACCETQVVCCPTPCEPITVCPADPCGSGMLMGPVMIESAPAIPQTTDSAPPAPMSEPTSDLPEATEEPAEDSATAEEAVPSDEPPASEEDAPAAEEPASPSDVADPVPAEPAEPSPFDEPAPAEEPTTESPAVENPAAENPAAENPAAPEPSTDEPAADEPFSFDEPAPAEEPTPAPAEEPAADPFDFGTPDEAPAEEPAAATDDDPFNILNDLPAVDPPAAAPAAGSDPFEEPLNPTSTRDKDQELEEKRKSIFDELFGAIQQVPAWYAAAAEEVECQLIAQQHEERADSMVSVASAKTVPTINETEMRTWQDDTGTFTTEGRLILITKTFVRLLKPNGRTCTVPVERLSADDAEYVSQVAKATQVQKPLLAMSN